MDSIGSVFCRARGRAGHWLGALVIFLGFAAVSGAATMGTSSWLQANLSWMPFSDYDYAHPAVSNGPFSVSCPPGASVRSCFQTVLGNLRAQGVSGVRIFVSFCYSNSLAFSNCGSPYQQMSWNPNVNPGLTWINNVKSFFQDVNAAGIENVTISLTGEQILYSQTASEASSPLGSCSVNGNCYIEPPGTVSFSASAPFGFQADNLPIGSFWDNGLNNAYNKTPVNPYFMGWTNEFNVINAVLGAAKGLVNVYELETQQELDTMDFTANLRYIYDNSSPQSAGLQPGQIVNVLGNLRSLMSANGFDPGRVDWSATWTEASNATTNCTNIYTDFAKNWGLDTIAQAITGGYIGVNAGQTKTNNLICGTSSNPEQDLQTMFISPIYSTQPDIVDAHIYSQVVNTTNTDALIQQVAAMDFGDIPHFLILASDQSANIVIGETWPGTMYTGMINGQYDFQGGPWPAGAPSDNVAGFNNEGVQLPLSSFTVTFRPWMELEDNSGKFYAYGQGPSSSSNYQNVNYNGQGPYTPTNH